MKKAILLKKITSGALAAALMLSLVSCSSDNDNEEEDETTTTVETTEETSDETSEETTTVETTTEETTTAEETTVAETSEETAITTVDDPDTAEYTDPEVRNRARWYLDNGYDLEYMGHDDAESWWGQGTNIEEGFAAAEPGDNIFTIDYVMKFPDHESADAFLNQLDGSDFGTMVRTDNADGSCTFELSDGAWTGTLSANNVLEMVCHPEAVS